MKGLRAGEERGSLVGTILRANRLVWEMAFFSCYEISFIH